MKIGISMTDYEGNSGPVILRSGLLSDKIRIARELGYDGVDLFSNTTDVETARETGEAFRKMELEIQLLIAVPLSENGVNLADPDAARREKSVQAYLHQIDVAQVMGAKGMPVGYLRGSRAENVSAETYEETLAQSLRRVSEYAANRNVKIWLEPINRYEINTLNSAKDTLRFLKQYALWQVDLLLDAFHMNIEDSGLTETITGCSGRIGHVHLPDNQRYACGSGCFDFTAILDALDQAGFEDYVSVEAYPVYGEYESAAMSMETLKRAMEILKGVGTPETDGRNKNE